LNARKRRWLEFLSEYDFDIKHIKGKENKGVNALSKIVHIMHATTISMHQSDLKSRILDVVVTNQHYLHVNESLQQEDVEQKIQSMR
jgi:hypothetical protein